MTKKLSEIYAPKSKDEKAFVAKHTVKKTDKRQFADKGEDVRYTGGNIKAIDRAAHRQGYNPGQDQKAYGVTGNNPSPTDQKTVTTLAPYTVKMGEEEEIDEGNPINKMKRKAFDINLGRKKTSKQSNITSMKRLGRKLTKEDGGEFELDDEDIDTLLDILGDVLSEDLDELEDRH